MIKENNLKSTCHPWASVSATRGSRKNKALHITGFPTKWGMTGLIISLILFLTMGIATSAWAAITYDETAGTCAGGSGKMFIGVDGEKYCRSNVTMNWWSAFAWCEASGGTLVPLDRCNGKNGNITGNVACPNFNGKNTSDCWTSSVPNSTNGYRLSSGAVNGNASRYSSNLYALCE